MNKKVRILLYLLSLSATVLVLALLIFYGRMQKPVSTKQDNVAEQTEMVLETEKTAETETELQTESAQEGETETETEINQEDTVLLFGGDVLIKASTESIYKNNGVTGLVSEEILAEMQNADIMMVNHEFQFSTRGEPMEDKQFTFQTDPKNVQILLDLGIDIVSLANNHSLDFGQDALQDTFVTLDEAGILYAGAGDSKERAEELQVIEVNGKKFGFLAATRVIPVAGWDVRNKQPGLFTTYDDTRLVERIRESKEECDFLAVYVHWGIEREEYPEEYQNVIAKHCVEAGADVIIGAHPHVLQGIEFIDEKPVFYSLGNYIFNSNIPKTMLVKVVIKADDTVEYSLIPAFATNGRTQAMEGTEAEKLYAYMNEISVKNYVNSDGSVTNKTE